MGHGQEDLVEDGHVVVIAHFDLIERHVNVVTESRAASNVVVIGLAQVRPEGAVLIAVDGEIQHSATEELMNERHMPSAPSGLPRIIVKHLLSGLAVMNVPIDDQYLLQSLVVQGVLRGQRHVVVVTITAVFALHGVVSRRPEYVECSTFLVQFQLELLPDDGHSVSDFAAED